MRERSQLEESIKTDTVVSQRVYPNRRNIWRNQ